MSFFWFGSKSKKESYSLVIYLSSGSVSGALVKFTEKPGIQVVNFCTEPIPFQAKMSVARHEELMKKSFQKVLAQINFENLSIQKIFHLVASPWSVSQCQTIRIRESKKVKLTTAYLQKVIDRELADSDFIRHNKMIERQIIQIRANGYAVNQVRGEAVSDATVSVFSTVVSNSLIHDLKSLTESSYPKAELVYHSISLPIFSVIRDLFPFREDFVYLDISEEMTDISIVKSGVIAGSVSFPFGRHQFVRELAQKTNTPEAIADSTLKNVAERSMDKMASAYVSAQVNSLIDKWTTKVVTAFDRFTENLALPQAIFFVTTNDLVFLLKDRLVKAGLEVVNLEARKITSPIKLDDTMFKIGLVFLDKIYKI